MSSVFILTANVRNNLAVLCGVLEAKFSQWHIGSGSVTGSNERCSEIVAVTCRSVSDNTGNLSMQATSGHHGSGVGKGVKVGDTDGETVGNIGGKGFPAMKL
jgi:hypothetical protein